jgi:predicted deacylase
VLYVHSTQHGNEISGVEVVRRVAQSLDPRRLRGTLIAVPVANPLALRWRRHHYLQGPEEAYQARPELDLDHFWPGERAERGERGERGEGGEWEGEGTAVQRLARTLWDGAVRHATHVLDMHTWNRWQAAATTVRAWHAPSLELATAFGLWVQARWTPGADDEAGTAGGAVAERGTERGAEQGGASGGGPPRGSVTGMAIRAGKAACAPNFTGQWDIYEPEVRRGIAGLRGVLRHLEMLPPGSPGGRGAGGEAPARPPVVFSTDDLVDVRVPAEGIFRPRVRPEQRVSRGDVLGELVPLGDFVPQPVLAPLDALVYLVGAIGPGADVALPPMMPIAPAGGRVARLLPLERTQSQPPGAPA